MKKYLLTFLIVSAVFSCKKDVAVKTDHIKYFSLNLKWDIQPQVFKDAQNNIVMGMNDYSADSTPVFRLIKISSEGDVLVNKTIKDSELFPGNTNLFTKLHLQQENGRIFLITNAIRTTGTDNRPYLLIAEFNEQLELVTNVEKKMQIGQLSITNQTPFFIHLLSDGFVIAMNTVDENQKATLYFEKTNLNFETKLYKKLNDTYWEETGSSTSSFYVYSTYPSGQPALYGYDQIGNLLWTHSIQYSNAALSSQKIKMTCGKNQIMVVPMAKTGTSGSIVTYACGYDGNKISETSIGFNPENYLSYLSAEDQTIYYCGSTCTGAAKCKPFWAKLNAQMQVEFSKVLPDDFSQNMQALFVGENSSGYYLFGLKDDYSSNVPMAFFLTTDHDGAIGK